MTTPRTRSLVSLATLTVSLTLAGCAAGPSRLVSDAPAPADAALSTIRLDNEGRDYVDVYLVGAQREWALGRVAPGARARLRIPDAALTEDAGSMGLAVLSGAHRTLRVADEPRAVVTIAQPAAGLASQKWTFRPGLTQGQLIAMPFGRGDAAHP